MADKESKEPIFDKLRFIYLALPFFKKKAEECESDFDKWIYVLKHMEALTRMPFTAQKEIFNRLAEYADTHHLNKKEYEAYQNSLWIAHDNAAVLEGAKIEANEETAKRSLSLGLPPDQVAQITNLPLERVLKLQQSM